MNCEFCKKVLSTKGNLIYHQKNNKSCLLIQQKKGDNQIEIQIELMNCEFCNKTFSESNLIKHLLKCKIKPQVELESLRKEKDAELEILRKEKDTMNMVIENLEKKNMELIIEISTLKNSNSIYEKMYNHDHKEIIKMAKEPKTTNNNKIKVKNNFFKDSEKVKEIINTKLNRFDIADGQKGIAKFAMDNFLKDDEGIPNYICTDPSRHIFKYQNENGDLEKDIKATKLTNLLFENGLKTKTNDIGKSLWTKEDGSYDVEKFRIYQDPICEINTMNSDNTTFRNELACLTIL
jgi:hypothetical protein